MLHPTHHHPFLFKFNPFSQPSSSSSSLSLQEMESVQGDSRSGFGPETAKTAAVVDDVNGGAGDDFFVDELLDFSNGYCESTEEQPLQTEEPSPEKEQGKEKEIIAPPESGVLSVKDAFGCLRESEFSVQEEGLESLEWLSQFVEESFSDYSLTGKLLPEKKSETVVEVPIQEQPCFTTPVQTKARSKRARSGVRVWPVLSSSFTESSTSSSSSTSSTTSFSLSQTDYVSLKKPPAKKQKNKLADGGGAGAAQPRRCTHCGVTKTPQWRAGPLGAKTLCNACGVRFKSGRLLPEYRPACSPNFSTELHSNNHRKVLEMRRKKEMEMEAAGPAPAVQSF